MRETLNLKILFIIVFLFSCNQGFSQIGGDNSYEFLNLTYSPRIAAMGGNFLAVKDNDINMTLKNPSLITPNMNNDISFSFTDFYTDINYGYAMYSRTYEKIGSFVGSIQYVDYGSFTYTDPSGNSYGDFKVSDYAFNLGWGRQLDSCFSIGSNLKFIYSDLESYNSFGIAVDVAATYHNSDKNLTVSFLARNIGRQLKAYNSGNIEPLPFELQLGLSKKLLHMPFRYSILINHIEKWDLSYEDPNDPNNIIDPFTGEKQSKSDLEKFGDNLLRHIVIGGEFSITKNFNVRIGYNYQRRNELKVYDKVSTVGFSWGLGIKISKFKINYSRARYHLVGSPNYLSVTANLSDFIPKKH